MKKLKLLSLAATAAVMGLVGVCGWDTSLISVAQAAPPNAGDRSVPYERVVGSRKPVREDYEPRGNAAIPPNVKLGAPGTADIGAVGPSILIVDPVVSAGLLGDTQNDTETSIAVNPQDPREIVISAFSGAWGTNAPIWYSSDGGITWTERLTIGAPTNPGGLGASGGPNDWTFDYGRNDQLSGAILTCRPGPVCNVVTGTTTDPTSAASWAYTAVSGNTQLTNNGTASSIDNSDQPWGLVNRDATTASQDNVYVAYDNFGTNPTGMQVAVSYNSNPPNFIGPDVTVGQGGGGVNPGLRLAKDPRTGYMYSLWQRCTANCNTNNAKTIDFYLNRSTDGGATWTLNGSGTGIVVASGDSFQPRPKFGTVNALLGGINHAAVDPNTGVLYYAYGDIDTVQRIALRRVQNDGTGNVTVSGPSWVSPNLYSAALPSVAVTNDGTVGVFYMTAEGFSSDGWPIFAAWLALSGDQGATFTSYRLQSFLSPVKDDGVADSRQRILGDYEQMKAQGNCFYGAFPGNGAIFGTTNSQIDPIFFKTCTGPQIQVNSSLTIGDTCVGSSTTGTLNVCNAGLENLVVQSIASSNTQFAVTPTSGSFPVNISPDFCFPFNVVFTPTAPAGSKTGTLTITSNDPASPTTVNLSATAGVPLMSATMEANGVFGNVVKGENKTLNLQVVNTSSICPLNVTSLTRTSGDTDFAFAGLAGGLTLPMSLPVGQNVNLPIRFAPTGFTPPTKTANFQLVTDDAAHSPLNQTVSGESFEPDIAISGDLAFGEVCAETTEERKIQVCNVGTVNTLTGVNGTLVGPGCGNFQIVGTPFPADISHDFCLDVTVKYTPTGVGAHDDCKLHITSNDPDEGAVDVPLSGTTPAPVIDVNPDLGFLPEVVQSTGACSTKKPFPIQNDGQCHLTVTDVQTTGDFTLNGMPSVPVVLNNGELVGDGGLGVTFAPTVIQRERTGVLSVTYKSDPITGATTQVNRQLCGEGVNTGARVLVTANGAPLAMVEQIKLLRTTANRNKKVVDTVDVSKNLSLQTYSATAPCPSFQFHKEYGTVSNPVQLLPGSYTVNVTAIVNGKRKTKTVAFDVQTCDFNPTVVVDM